MLCRDLDAVDNGTRSRRARVDDDLHGDRFVLLDVTEGTGDYRGQDADALRRLARDERRARRQGVDELHVLGVFVAVDSDGDRVRDRCPRGNRRRRALRDEGVAEMTGRSGSGSQHERGDEQESGAGVHG
jgi:hypothetical protein